MAKKAVFIIIFFSILLVAMDFFNKSSKEGEQSNNTTNNTNTTIKIAEKKEAVQKVSSSAPKEETKDKDLILSSANLAQTSAVPQKLATPSLVQDKNPQIIKPNGPLFCFNTSSTDKALLLKVTDHLDKLGANKYTLTAKPTSILYHIIWGLSPEEKQAYDILYKMQSTGLFANKKITLSKVNGYWSMNMAQMQDLQKAQQEINVLKTGAKDFGGIWFLQKSSTPSYFLDFSTDSNKLENAIIGTFTQISWEKSACN